MSDRWRRYNQNIWDNLEDDEDKEFVMRTLAQQYDNDCSDDEPKQPGECHPREGKHRTFGF